MAKGGFPGGMGGMNMNNLMKQAQKMQKQMMEKQEELQARTLEMTSGGGAVKVVISGKKEIQELKINPDVVDPDDFLSMGKATPFQGWEIRGKCIATVCDGKIVYQA